MLTEATTEVDASAPRAVMWTVSQVAERDGVSKQAVSRKVRALADKHDLTVERNDRGHIVRLNVAEYDHLRGRFDDPSKAQRPTAAPPPATSAETYDEALRQKTWTEAERARISLAELKGDLVRVAAIRDASRQCAEAIVGIIDRLPSSADELAEAVARDGGHGLRVVLKAIAARMRGDVASALEALGGSEVTPQQGEAAAPPVNSDVGSP